MIYSEMSTFSWLQNFLAWPIKVLKKFLLWPSNVLKWRFLTGVTRYRNGSCQWSEPFGHGWDPWPKRVYHPKGFGARATKTRDISIFLILARVWYFQHEIGIKLWNGQFLSRVPTMPKWFGSLTTPIPVPDHPCQKSPLKSWFVKGITVYQI